MIAKIHFYHYKDVPKPSTLFSRLRLWLQSRATRMVHCNIEIENKVYDLASWGGSVWESAEYPFKPTKTVTIAISEKEFHCFLSKYRVAATRNCPAVCHLLAVFAHNYDNCATIVQTMVRYRATTPDELLRFVDCFDIGGA